MFFLKDHHSCANLMFVVTDMAKAIMVKHIFYASMLKKILWLDYFMSIAHAETPMIDASLIFYPRSITPNPLRSAPGDLNHN